MGILVKQFGSLRKGGFPALLLAFALGGCSLSQSLLPEEKDSSPVALEDAQRQSLPYEVHINGVEQEDGALLAQLQEVSNAIRLEDRPPSSRVGLQRRAEDDQERFVTVLKSFGFYDATVDFDVSPETSAAEKVQLTYRIDPGSVYLLAEAEIALVRDGHSERRPLTDAQMEKTGLQLGMPAKADPIIEAEKQVVEFVRREGFPLAHAQKRSVIADTERKTLSVTYRIEAGEKAVFGDTRVFGATEVDSDFIASYREWERGAQFDPEQVSDMRTQLARSNLFESVTVKPAKAVTPDGEIPMEVEVVERKHRTIGGGVDYSTADGPGANAFWEHRNLMGAGERLRLRLKASALEQGGEADFRKPQFLRDRQRLVAEGEAKNFDTEGYQGVLASGFLGVERELSKTWSATVGGVLEYSDLAGANSPNEQFYLGGLRTMLRRDSTDNLLDPSKGSRSEIEVAPYTSLTGKSSQFVQVALGGSRYYSIDEDKKWIIAGRGRVGMIFGDELEALPSNKRFFSGGGGTVRGYEFQSIGPLDGENEPTGGRSTIDLGVELRARLTEDIGLVPFIEGGNVFDTSTPDSFDLFWAAGLGIRYYTAVGPLRFDVAIPLDKRDNIDDDFQLYFSIGQAF